MIMGRLLPGATGQKRRSLELLTCRHSQEEEGDSREQMERSKCLPLPACLLSLEAFTGRG